MHDLLSLYIFRNKVARSITNHVKWQDLCNLFPCFVSLSTAVSSTAWQSSRNDSFKNNSTGKKVTHISIYATRICPIASSGTVLVPQSSFIYHIIMCSVLAPTLAVYPRQTMSCTCNHSWLSVLQLFLQIDTILALHICSLLIALNWKFSHQMYTDLLLDVDQLVQMTNLGLLVSDEQSISVR